ncbi:MAG TPA: FAD-dependent oxidoreductase [Actinophytocola sp.]|uniref:FAD-dependent oxidoreductase n=1 Tax=Actinophytocola sp. TaxID=1872138 RepID=UPI002DDCA33E|nr:FAD-dependent oxidoreductase [Actinophytocola sp.]HEV2778127.1 FAD-dependent oxidoreductase [Actinophytocola sp.]
MRQRAEAIVVGAGVIGMTTAVCLAESGLSVRVRASEPPHHTTSAVAGAIAGGPAFSDPDEVDGMWEPYEVNVRRHQISLDEFTGLAAAEPDSGVRLRRGRMVCATGDEAPKWARRQPGFQDCSPDERAGFPVAFWMSVPVIDMRSYFDYLIRRLRAADGIVEIRPLESFDQLASQVRLVVNCAGVGAGRLANDPEVFPVRGQHVVVENPGLDDFLFEFFAGRIRGPQSVTVIPHSDRVILGSTADRHNWSREPDPAATKEILRRCGEVEPRLVGARVLGVEVGLRVARPGIRLETEQVGDLTVIHNYGHGPVGVGMSWGCAREVAELALAGSLI